MCARARAVSLPMKHALTIRHARCLGIQARQGPHASSSEVKVRLQQGLGGTSWHFTTERLLQLQASPHCCV